MINVKEFSTESLPLRHREGSRDKAVLCDGFVRFALRVVKALDLLQRGDSYQLHYCCTNIMCVKIAKGTIAMVEYFCGTNIVSLSTFPKAPQTRELSAFVKKHFH